MKVDNEILSVLDNAEKEGNALRLVGQLDRNLYTKANKVLEAAGGKWNRKAKAHIFDGDAADAMEQIILTGEVTVPQDFGFFPTPAPVVELLIKLADIKVGSRVLEPSAGRGAIAKACADVGAVVHCHELMEENFNELASDSRMASVTKVDFLSVEPQPIFCRVVMNPPFMKQADIKHVTHALKFLKKGGLLVSVMSASVTFRDNKLTTDFRALIRERGGEIEGLPEGSFKSSGTGVNTVIVTIPAGGA